jgi:ubiquinone/menaquinone biosynthesis C-methylase UbiE
MPQPAYVLGHSPAELERLSRQHRLVGGFTRRLFEEAGLGDCRRVLDVGSGAGDVAFLAADLIGPEGLVVGVDREAAAVATAQHRAAELGLSHVRFLQGDPATCSLAEPLHDAPFDAPFDAIVGRYVLVFQSDPAAWLRSLAGRLRPGGVLVLHEPDFHDLRSNPSVPSYDRCCHWVSEAFRRGGTAVQMADTLLAAFRGADLPSPRMHLETAVGGGETIGDWLDALAELATSLEEAMVRYGVVSAEELDVPNLAARLRRDVSASGAMVFGRSEVGAWCRLPIQV